MGNSNCASCRNHCAVCCRRLFGRPIEEREEVADAENADKDAILSTYFYAPSFGPEPVIHPGIPSLSPTAHPAVMAAEVQMANQMLDAELELRIHQHNASFGVNEMITPQAF